MKEFYFLHSTLVNQYNWKCVSNENLTELWKLGSNNTSESIPHDKIPDVIIFWEKSISQLTPDPQVIKNLRKYNPKLKIVYFCDDLHGLCVQQNDLVRIFRSIDTFMGPYAYRFKNYFQHLLKNLTTKEYPELLWSPHSASPPFTDDQTISFRSESDEKLFLAGAVNGYYPYRKWLSRNMKLVGNVVFYPHPGYRNNVKNQTEIFASNINKYLASFTCGSTFQYVVAKVFEIPATGSLLMLNNHLDDLMKALGFFPQVHYYNYSALDPLPDIQWVFRQENRAKVDKMRRNGMIEARKHHRTSLRAQAIYEYFHSGTVTYKITETFLQAPCPNVAQKENCKPTIY